MPAPTPPLLTTPIAVSAAPANITKPLPPSPTGTNAASIQGGFPPETMQPELAGGLPPLGQDMNGYLFLLSSHTLYLEGGQLYLYNATLATALGGYAIGTILGMSDGSGSWLNLTANNTTNPDAGGAGWVAISSYGFGVVNGLIGGTIALTSAQARRNVIVLQGTLVSNLIVQFPPTLQQWLVINQTTGAFTTKVVSSGPNGVSIPQGGLASPVGVYGDGTNLYPVVTPLAVAIDQAPTALTLVERTNTGQVLATVFNSNTGVTDPVVENVIVDAGDGNFQKITLANLLSQLASSNFAAKGHSVLPGGLIVNWVPVSSGGGGSISQTWDLPFPNAILGISEGVNAPGGTGGAGSYVHNFTAVSKTGFTYLTTAGGVTVYVIAIGN